MYHDSQGREIEDLEAETEARDRRDAILQRIKQSPGGAKGARERLEYVLSEQYEKDHPEDEDTRK